jgi:hypothetical protein
MKHMILLLSFILCQVHVILPAALEESREDPGLTGPTDTDSYPYQAVRIDLQRPAPPTPAVLTRILQSQRAPKATPMSFTPTIAPTMTLPPMDRLPQLKPLRCTASSICPGQNLMHSEGTPCRQSCVRNSRVDIMDKAGWKCGKCP